MPPMVINGRQAGSKEEYNFYLALRALKIDFGYQVPIGGFAGERGTPILDFLLYIPPKPVMCRIGEMGYWHSGKYAAKDKMDQIQLQERSHGRYDGPVDFNNDDCKDAPSAIAAIRKKVRV